MPQIAKMLFKIKDPQPGVHYYPVEITADDIQEISNLIAEVGAKQGVELQSPEARLLLYVGGKFASPFLGMMAMCLMAKTLEAELQAEQPKQLPVPAGQT